MHIERSLAALQDRLDSLRDELRSVEERLLFRLDALEEARARKLVSATPVADEEYRSAREGHGRLLRRRDEIAAEMQELQGEQDRLLDRMLEPHAASSRARTGSLGLPPR